jgi:hypothetical protein
VFILHHFSSFVLSLHAAKLQIDANLMMDFCSLELCGGLIGAEQGFLVTN